MTFHKFNIQSAFEGILKKRGNIVDVIHYDKIDMGDILVHTLYFIPKGDSVALFEVTAIIEERPARGVYQDEATRPTFRKMEVVTKDFPLSEVDAFFEKQKRFDEKTKRMVDYVAVKK